MNEESLSPLAYLGKIFATSRRHGGELTAAVICVIAAVLATLVVRSWLHLRDLGGSGNVLLVLLPAIGAVLMFEAALAAWRLHRRQLVTLATRQTLLDLDAIDRVELERHLLARYRRRERRIEMRNEVRIQRLTSEIDALTSNSHER